MPLYLLDTNTVIPAERSPTMKAMTNAEFAAQVAELAKNAGPPQATAVYDADGDCIELLSRGEMGGEKWRRFIFLYFE
jgi:hypothetical protein